MLGYVIEAAVLGLLLAPFLLRRWLAYIVVIPIIAGFHFFPWTTGIIIGVIVVIGYNRMIVEGLGGKEAMGPGRSEPPKPASESPPPIRRKRR